MARRRTVRGDEAAEVIQEARRILKDKDTAALADSATLGALEEAASDDFDETFSAEKVAALLAADVWRTLKNRLAQRRSQERAVEDGTASVHVRLPPDIVQALSGIAPSPVEAIRQLLAGSGTAVPEPGSEEFCRSRLCMPEVPLADPGRWECRTCGLVGRADWPFNRHMMLLLAASADRTASLRDVAADIYERFPGGLRFTTVAWAADQSDLPRRERRQAKAERSATLSRLADHGLLEEAPGPRGGAGYRTLEEPPEWLADLLVERRAEHEAEETARQARAVAVQRAIAEGLSYTTEAGTVTHIEQTEYGLELVFPAAPAVEVRETMKLDGDCKWDPDRRRWLRMRPVASVEPWLAEAIEAGATVLPRLP
ncbi:hypothetical protein JJL56_01870 [Azospirillum sp. YIM DDC1]|uniref:Uncharacterized protein n=1 Tax=Azospirillum aestuarii TaxID=2802052 RepID=A0ABS1HS11_9PROT|nr:hypothetical protein [Azospirillum aestuarii]MBK4717607.1 hypothetical protein [Azospirillum aestuarii]